MTLFTYDGNGSLLTVSDALDHTITHEYDGMGRLSRRIDQVGTSESFAYNGVGNLVSTTDRKGQTTTFTYDGLNRRTRATYVDGAVETFAYDAVGRLVQADDTADPHRPITLTYDTLDRLVDETTSIGTVAYEYDILGRRTQMRVNGLNPVAYTYDTTSRLRTVTQAPLNPVTIDYDAPGRRTRLTLPNGVSTEYQYDAALRLTALIYRNAASPLGGLTYTYDPAGNRTGVGGTFARTPLPDPVPSATYDAANRQLTFSDKAMSYDANGRLTSIIDSRGVSTFTRDGRNRLTVLATPSTVANFPYNPLWRRTAKTTNSPTTQHIRDGLNIIQEANSFARRTISARSACMKRSALRCSGDPCPWTRVPYVSGPYRWPGCSALTSPITTVCNFTHRSAIAARLTMKLKTLRNWLSREAREDPSLTRRQLKYTRLQCILSRGAPCLTRRRLNSCRSAAHIAISRFDRSPIPV